jgi:translation initiation factor 2D
MSFFKKEITCKSDQKLSSKDLKKLNADVQRELCLSDEDTSALIGKRGIALRKPTGGVTAKLWCEGDKVVVFEARGCLLPSLSELWRDPALLPALIVHPPVSEFVLGGADLMLPGVCGMKAVEGSLTLGGPAAILVVGNPSPIAIGRCAVEPSALLAALESDARPKGTALEVLHVFGDSLWRYGGLQLPRGNKGFAVGAKRIESIVDPVVETARAVAAVDISDGAVADGSGDGSDCDGGVDGDGGGGDDDDSDGDGGASSDGNGDAANESDGGVAARAEMDDLLQRCFLQAAHAVPDSGLPMSINVFYSSFMRPLRPAGTSLDVKASNFKKLAPLLAQMEAASLCTVRTGAAGKPGSKGKPAAKAAGEAMLGSISRTAEAYTTFTPWKAVAADEVAAGPSGFSAARIVVSELYRPCEAQRPLFDRLGLSDRKAFYSEREAVAALERHLASAATPGGPGPATPAAPVRLVGTVTLDPLLADALYKGGGAAAQTSLGAKELLKLWVSRLEPWFHASGGRLEKPLVRPGRSPPCVRISTAQRRGHSVTLVEDLDAYAISAKALAAALQARLGASASVETVECKSGVTKHAVMVQGLWDRAVAEHLEEALGLPSRCVANNAKKGLAQKKEKKASNVRRA